MRVYRHIHILPLLQLFRAMFARGAVLIYAFVWLVILRTHDNLGHYAHIYAMRAGEFHFHFFKLIAVIVVTTAIFHAAVLLYVRLMQTAFARDRRHVFVALSAGTLILYAVYPA